MTFEQKTYVEVLGKSLSHITSPLSRRLSASQLGLTPKELEVAHLASEGKNTIDIAKLMHVTANAVGSTEKTSGPSWAWPTRRLIYARFCSKCPFIEQLIVV